MRDAEDVREHAAVLGARERLHAVVGEHRIAIAVRGMARGAGAAGTARDLEGDDDALANLQPAHRVPELEGSRRHLVAERERPARREQAGGEEEIDVAPCDGERTDEGFAVSLEPRRGNVLPSDGVGCAARELSHGRQLPSGADHANDFSARAVARDATAPPRGGPRPASHGAPRSGGRRALPADRRGDRSTPSGRGPRTAPGVVPSPAAARTGSRSIAQRRDRTPPRSVRSTDGRR